MTLDHETHMAAIGLPTRNLFDWRVAPPAPKEETPVQRNARLSRERWRKTQREKNAAKKAALRVNPESSLGYSNQDAADRTMSIRGRG